MIIQATGSGVGYDSGLEWRVKELEAKVKGLEEALRAQNELADVITNKLCEQAQISRGDYVPLSREDTAL